MAFNTPFKIRKRYESTAAPPTRASSPGHQLQSARPVAASCGTKYHHAIDIAPTILDTVGVEAPETIKGHAESRLDGVSMCYSVTKTFRKTQFYSMLGCRGSWHDGWKAVTTQAGRAGQHVVRRSGQRRGLPAR